MPSLLPCHPKDPDYLNDWVDYQDSLINKLHALTGHVALKRLFQDWVRPCWWERQVLDMTEPLLCRREIVIGDGRDVYWYARTIIPSACYELEPAFFDRLEQEPLRNLIFNEPKVNKQSRYCYCIDERCIEYYWVKDFIKNPADLIWVRVTKLCFKAKESFYLIELLLPQLGVFK